MSQQSPIDSPIEEPIEISPKENQKTLPSNKNKFNMKKINNIVEKTDKTNFVTNYASKKIIDKIIYETKLQTDQ
jgi:hypothetical protein